MTAVPAKQTPIPTQKATPTPTVEPTLAPTDKSEVAGVTKTGERDNSTLLLSGSLTLVLAVTGFAVVIRRRRRV